MSAFIQILINNRPATKYLHNRETYIEGRNGSTFKLRLYNPTYRRAKVIVSVDGLSVMTGEPASDSDSGYLVNAHSHVDIDGWRISDQSVREFFFTALENTYNSKTGSDEQNIGVIGAKLFREKVYEVYKTTHWIPEYKYYDPAPMWPTWTVGVGSANASFNTDSALRGMSYNSVSLNASAPVAESAQLSASGASYVPDSYQIGTGMGAAKSAPVTEVAFEAETFPWLTEVIYYDTLQGLQRRGVDVKRINYRPDPFPGNKTYCKQV